MLENRLPKNLPNVMFYISSGSKYVPFIPFLFHFQVSRLILD